MPTVWYWQGGEQDLIAILGTLEVKESGAPVALHEQLKTRLPEHVTWDGTDQ